MLCARAAASRGGPLAAGDALRAFTGHGAIIPLKTNRKTAKEPAMETISREKLRQMKDQHDDLMVVDVLGEDAYKEYHLPGAINVPVTDNFEQKIQQAVPDKDRPVVVYCANTDCQASPDAAEKMEGLGYKKVYDYEAGKQDWKEAGLSVVVGPQPG